ncbi:hypothetical protein ACJX0J_005492, partial [Zea mays]
MATKTCNNCIVISRQDILFMLLNLIYIILYICDGINTVRPVHEWDRGFLEWLKEILTFEKILERLSGVHHFTLFLIKDTAVRSATLFTSTVSTYKTHIGV